MKTVRAAIAVAGLMAAGWTAGIAAADPGDAAPQPDPAAPLPIDPAAQTLLGQFAQAAQLNPFGAMADLLADSPQPALLGQGPLPPGTISSGPGIDPLAAAQLLKPNNFRMPTPDQASPYALAPNDAPSPFARIDAWKGVHAMLHGSVGRMPGDELGQALPGTAAPPGSNLPPGLEQFYVDPAAVPAPPVMTPADPLLPQGFPVASGN